MTIRFLSLGAAFLAAFTPMFAEVSPTITVSSTGQRAGTKLVDITYDLASAASQCTVWADISSDGGRSWMVPAITFSGNYGQGVEPGTALLATWDAGADFDGLAIDEMRIRLHARAGTIPIPPLGMVYVPGGHFQMGEWIDGSSAGTVAVSTDAFFMDRYEVTYTLWRAIRIWGVQNGYELPDFYDTGALPVRSSPYYYGEENRNLDWYAAVKWCNARSEREGLTPVYFTDASHSTVYRTGSVDITNAMVDWDANGYRLPTEAEWEKAARGGLSGKRFPWGNDIDATMAKYWSSGQSTWHPVPVGSFNGYQAEGGNDMANGYGLYDMAGNVSEWCWDLEGPLEEGSNPRGPSVSEYGVWRRVRGGDYFSMEGEVTVHLRSGSIEGWESIGFRTVRRAEPVIE